MIYMRNLKTIIFKFMLQSAEGNAVYIPPGFN